MTPTNCWTRTAAVDGLIQAAKEIHMYKVIVDSIGKVHRGYNLEEARRQFNAYSDASQTYEGMTGGKNVVMTQDGHLIHEFRPDPEVTPPTDAEICGLALQVLMGYGLEDDGVEAGERLISELGGTNAADNS